MKSIKLAKDVCYNRNGVKAVVREYLRTAGFGGISKLVRDVGNTYDETKVDGLKMKRI